VDFESLSGYSPGNDAKRYFTFEKGTSSKVPAGMGYFGSQEGILSLNR